MFVSKARFELTLQLVGIDAAIDAAMKQETEREAGSAAPNCYTATTRREKMDEESAKRQGFDIHRRDMAFIRGFVSCTNCAANYNASNPSEKTFCQMYSRPIDPGDTERNIFHAEACEQWIPDGLDRSKVVTPQHRYWYDD